MNVHKLNCCRDHFALGCPYLASVVSIVHCGRVNFLPRCHEDLTHRCLTLRRMCCKYTCAKLVVPVDWTLICVQICKYKWKLNCFLNSVTDTDNTAEPNLFLECLEPSYQGHTTTPQTRRNVWVWNTSLLFLFCSFHSPFPFSPFVHPWQSNIYLICFHRPLHDTRVVFAVVNR